MIKNNKLRNFFRKTLYPLFYVTLLKFRLPFGHQIIVVKSEDGIDKQSCSKYFEIFSFYFKFKICFIFVTLYRLEPNSKNRSQFVSNWCGSCSICRRSQIHSIQCARKHTASWSCQVFDQIRY